MIVALLLLVGIALAVLFVMRVQHARRLPDGTDDLFAPPEELRALWQQRPPIGDRDGGDPEVVAGATRSPEPRPSEARSEWPASQPVAGGPAGLAESADGAARVATLPELLDGVRFPDDLLPLTHGMTPVELDFRLVLVTRDPPASVHERLDGELRAAGFDLAWTDATTGAARRSDGTMAIRLHPPVTIDAIAGRAAGQLRRSKKGAAPSRPDFPSAPLEATVVELQATTPL